jgi:multiple antibiotic resistance protein
MSLLWEFFALAFSALLPLINPLGSAFVFLGLVGIVPPATYRSLARRIALNTVLFMAVIEIIGSTILSFFGVSLPIVQVSGGLVIAAIAWNLLNSDDSKAPAQVVDEKVDSLNVELDGALSEKTFYPFTFPITAGPGTIVTLLTLSAHVPRDGLSASVLAHLGIFLASVVLCGFVYLAYAYAPQIARAVPPSTAHGILRVIAFILLCIGVQIAWNGFSALYALLPAHP